MQHKIMVVDDEQDIRELVSNRLSREGYAVISAASGEEALEKMKSDDPDIVLLDLMLPGKNGFEVLQEIRLNYEQRWHPVIIISALNELETLKKCYHLTADHYLSKPCNMEDILNGIKTMISLIPVRAK